MVFSKKIIYSILFAVALLGWGLYSTLKTPSINIATNVDEPDLKLERQISGARVDTDGDGLEDWEEALWGTDPSKVDTDGDGVGDAQYVADLAEKNSPSSNLGSESISYLGENKTRNLAESFISQYLSLSNSGANLSGTGAQNFANNIANLNLVGGTKLSAKYLITDITISTDKNLREYGNELGNVFNENRISGDPLQFLAHGLDYEDPKDFEELGNMSKVYGNIEILMKKMVVPDKARNLHLDLLNNMTNLKNTLNLISKTLEDPVSGMIGISNYRPLSEELVALISYYKKLLQAEGINYSSEEGGYILIK